jgi:transposase
MTRHKTDPLRGLTEEERGALERLSRSGRAPAAQVARARVLLAVAAGASYTAAAEQIGRRSGDAVAHLVARFNAEGGAAVVPRHGGGSAPAYPPAARERILAEWRRTPDRERDGTGSWSLTTLQRALRQASDGLPQVSTYTIWCVLHDAGVSWQRDRSWCQTGISRRRRTRGPVTVVDLDTAAKKG